MLAKIWNFNTWIEETDPKALYVRFDTMLHEAGFNVLKVLEHHFTPYGYTCLFLLGESHFAVHTFPEHGKTYIELSSCNEEKHKKFIALLRGG